MKWIFVLLTVSLFIMPVSSQANSCEFVEIDDYNGLGEKTMSFLISVEETDYCVFEIEGNEDSNLIAIEASTGERVEDEELNKKLFFAYYSADFVKSNSEIIEEDYDRAFGEFKAEKDKYLEKFGEINSLIQNAEKNYVDICLAHPSAPVVKVCAGEDLKNLAVEKSCGALNQLICANWEKTEERFDVIRGKTNEFKSDRETDYYRVKDFYATAFTIKEFSGIVDRELDSSIQKEIRFNWNKTHKSNSIQAQEEYEQLNIKIDKIRSELEANKSRIADRLPGRKEKLIEDKKKGFDIKNQWDSYCKAKNELPADELLKDEEFSEFQNKLDSANASLSKSSVQMFESGEEQSIFRRIANTPDKLVGSYLSFKGCGWI